MEARLTEILQEKFQTGLEQATNEQVYYAAAHTDKGTDQRRTEE